MCEFISNIRSAFFQHANRAFHQPIRISKFRTKIRTPKHQFEFESHEAPILSHNMSLTEHRWSPSTVKFTYSPQPRPPLTIPTVSTIIDFINSIFQSSIVLIVVQWSAIHFESNRIFGPILRYLRHLLPYNDIRILDTGGKAFHITPYGGLCIVCLAMFLFLSKSMPMGTLLS